MSKRTKRTEETVADPNLDALLERYWESKETLDEAKEEVETIKEEIRSSLHEGVDDLTEEETAEFKSTSRRCQDFNQSLVSLYKTKRSSWDSDYLESVLTAEQLALARSYSTSLTLKITSNDKSED